MTITQRLEQKARQEGIQLGEQRGIEKGEREATLKIARTDAAERHRPQYGDDYDRSGLRRSASHHPLTLLCCLRAARSPHIFLNPLKQFSRR